MPTRAATILASLMFTLAAACSREPAAPAGPAVQRPYGQLDAQRLAAAATEPGQWFTPGRDGSGSYYSPLARIDAGNVGTLGFAWEYGLNTSRGLEATPLVIDGVMYAVGNWGRVYALDAANGRELWTYLPAVDGQWGRYACCDVVNRGLAVWRGKVYAGSLDGYLQALDAATGRLLWRVDTLPDRARRMPYTITGAPLVAGDSVVIGNGGSDFEGVRGYVSAYDLETGVLKWRFYTVPHDPKLGPQETPELERAVKSWDPRYRWAAGGGGTVWDGLAYDPKLKLVYLGTDNLAPYNINENGQKGGDDLYIASIVALNADTGRMAWYYQEVPQERWDYGATQKFVLAELVIGGRQRSVLMQAPKNGFFYLLDRATGEVLAAKPYAFVNWTKGLDAHARPLPSPAADYQRSPKLVFPGMAGAHNWQPMSFDAKTGLVYIPAIEAPMVFIETSRRPIGEVQGMFTVLGTPPEGYAPEEMAGLFGKLPHLEQLTAGITAPARSRGVLKAYDPVEGKVVWEQPGASMWDGGVLSTAGDLVIRGDATGHLDVYRATDGAPLRQIDVGTSIIAAPMTYEVGSEQFVAVMAGYGGGGGVVFGPETAAAKYGNAGRIVAFRLGGGPVPHPPAVTPAPFPKPPEREGTKQDIRRGELLYMRYCARCHAAVGPMHDPTLLPDLRRSSAATHLLYYDIVLGGAYAPKGMGRFDDVLTRADAAAIHAYILEEAWQAYTSQSPAKPP
jgi:quinohemoprotein ethanol dehydrogenase